jgi:Uncharacterized protein conserved in bacteria
MVDYQKILNKNLSNVFVDILKNIEINGLEGNNHLYITFTSNHKKNLIPDWLLHKYPSEMTIVIQHEYFNLSVNKNDFNIGLSFNNKKTDLKISYDAIVSFADPSANFGLTYNFNQVKNENRKKTVVKKNNTKKSKKSVNSSNVINFLNYKKN